MPTEPKTRGKAGRPVGSPNSVICGAVRSNGSVCRNAAGARTKHVGRGNCYKHGGATPSGAIFAGNKLADQTIQAMTEFSDSFSHEQRDLGPHEALLEELRRTAAIVDWLEIRLRLRVQGQTEEYMDALDRRFTRERTNLIRVAQVAIQAGVAEREVAIAERWASELGLLIQLIARDLVLTAEQKRALPEVVERHTRPLELLAG